MVSLDPVDGFRHSKGHFRVVFKANLVVRNNQCLYKSADFKINVTVSFDPVNGFGHWSF